MNIYLTMAITTEMDLFTPPLGLLVLTSVLERAEHKVKVIFPIELDEFLDNFTYEIKDCEVFGFTANSFNWYKTKKVIETIHKHNPDITIILGGPHPTISHEYCLKSTSAQIVVRNEGEITLPLTIEALSKKTSLHDIDGITYKDQSNEVIVNKDRLPLSEDELNNTPLPSYHIIPPNRYDFVPLETTRGCPFRCIFCGTPYPKSYRQISQDKVSRVLGTLSKITNRFKKSAIFLADDSFSTNKKHVTDILDLFKKNGSKFSFGFEVRISEFLKNDLISSFAMINIYLLQVGVECGYEEGLKTIGKKLKIQEVMQFAELCSQVSFRYYLYWSFIIGFPWESEDQVIKTIDFAYNRAVQTGSQPPQINNFAPYLGTEITNNYQKYNMQRITHELFDDPNWHKQFLGYTSISPQNRNFIFQYLQQRHQQYTTIPSPPFIQLPDGRIIDNSKLQ